MFNLDGQTVGFDRENAALVIIDQTRLPCEEVILRLCTAEEIFEAITSLRLRGAPCIGVSSAIAIAVLSLRSKAQDSTALLNEIRQNCDYLESARPTAVNLSWALGQMRKTAEENRDKTADEIRNVLCGRAQEIMQDDILRSRKIGEYGAELLKGKHSFLTHCNAGRLACVKYGTALAPVYLLKEQGEDIRVFADETRPLLQGARLTAYELEKAGIDTTVICDNMASYVLREGLVDAVLTGADRIASNGDTANKIGTSSLAVLCKYYGVPFYICAPFSTVDFKCKSGENIEIEMRDEAEISEKWYKNRMTPKNVKCLNPAFDITKAELITAYITEKGVFSAKELME